MTQKKAAVIIFMTAALYAQNSVVVNRTSSNTVEINLRNSQNAAGLQFTVRSSESVLFEKFQVSSRSNNDVVNARMVLAKQEKKRTLQLPLRSGRCGIRNMALVSPVVC